MNALYDKTFLIIDCQTTGMRPSVGHLLEFAWGFGSATSETFEIHSSVIQLPEGESIPPRVKEITGLKASDLERARTLESVRDEFISSIENWVAQTGERPIALIHYAQFEEAWLRDLLRDSKFSGEQLPFDLVCTHRISKKLFPQVPSRNVRGLTGFFGMRIGEIKRAAQHVLATQKIWKGIVRELEKTGLVTLEALQAYLSAKPDKKKKSATPAKGVSYEYRVDRAKRLALPDKPGIYKMIAQTGEILYVGKATCLKDRVNSYFRGKKGRDPRKLELMAQVWDLEVIECESAVEAALVESDEIKRLNPPYNVLLKEGGRHLLYYDRSLERESLVQSVDHPIGPFRRFNAIDHLRTFSNGLRSDLVYNVFYRPIESETLEAGYALFEEKYPGFQPEVFSLRDHLAFGFKLLRKFERDGGSEILAEEAPEILDLPSAVESLALEEEDYTPEDICEKIEELYVSAAQTYLRAKALTQLLWSDVSWTEKGETKSLAIRGGKIREGERLSISHLDRQLKTAPWHSLAISDYDRMSVLLSEISKVDHEIAPLRSPFTL